MGVLGVGLPGAQGIAAPHAASISADILLHQGPDSSLDAVSARLWTFRGLTAAVAIIRQSVRPRNRGLGQSGGHSSGGGKPFPGERGAPPKTFHRHEPRSLPFDETSQKKWFFKRRRW